MGGIFRIYKNDWRNLFRVPVAVLLIAALALLPSVYDWFNVAAVWDPYSNTSGIKIAVSNEDAGATVKDKRINIGEEVLESLKANKNLGWTFVDADTAHNGVQRGDYYASIRIPADFSKRMTGILTGDLIKPEILYTVNEKINAIAPKITDKGATSITAQVSERFMETIGETVFTVLQRLDKEFRSELPVIRRVEKGLFRLEASLPEIEAAGRKVLEIEKKWPEIHDSALRISTLESKLPEVEKAGEALQTIDEHWPLIRDSAAHLETLQDKLPLLEKAAGLITELDANFGSVEGLLDKGNTELASAEKAVHAAIEALPQVDRITAAGSDFGQKLQEFLERNNAAFESVAPVFLQNLYLLRQTEDAALQLVQSLQDSTGQQNPSETSASLSGRLASGREVLGHMISLLESVNRVSPGAVSSEEQNLLKTARTSLNSQAGLAESVEAALRSGATPDTGSLTQLGVKAEQGTAALDKLIARLEGGSSGMNGALQQLTAGAARAAEVMQQFPQRLPALAAVLEDAAAAIDYGQSGLQAVSQNLPAIREAVHTAASGITDKTAHFSQFMTEVLPRIQNALPAAGDKLHQAAAFAREDLPAVEDRVRQLSSLIRTGLPKADQGVARAGELIRDDLPLLESSIRKAAATLRQVKTEVNLDEIAQLVGGNIKSKSDFLANPIVLKENKLYPIPNYGSAMTPFYVVLSLWVGGTLMISLLRTGVDTGGVPYKGYQMYFGRLFTFLTVGILQAVIAAVGNIYILNCYVADKLWFIGFAVLISIVFVTIIYTLVAVFGNLGKGIAIVFMVLQFSSSGGTFPISTTGHFFQVLNPYMPFTYAISLMREAVGGILPEVAIRDVLYLISFGVLSLLLALFLKKPLERFIRKAAEQAEKSKLIS